MSLCCEGGVVKISWMIQICIIRCCEISLVKRIRPQGSSWYSRWFCAGKADPICLMCRCHSRKSPQRLCHRRFDIPSHDSLSVAAAWPLFCLFAWCQSHSTHLTWGADNSVIVLYDQLFTGRSFFCLTFLLISPFSPAPYPHLLLPPHSSHFFHLLHHNLIRYLISCETDLARR